MLLIESFIKILKSKMRIHFQTMLWVKEISDCPPIKLLSSDRLDPRCHEELKISEVFLFQWMKTNAKNSFLFHKYHLFYMGSAMSIVSEKWEEKKKE